jgi:hypothetical protein
MTNPMTITQTKAEYQTECLIEVVNNEWKVNAIENNRNHYDVLTMEVGRKYIKVWQSKCYDGVIREGRSCYMFIDKNDGACYKPASYKAPAKGIRFLIDQLLDNPEICDQYGGFLYKR